MPVDRLQLPSRLTLAYVGVAALWILISDIAIESIKATELVLPWQHTLKGMTFVAVTGALLYALLRLARQRLDADAQALQERDRRLSFAVETAGGAIWQWDLGSAEIQLSERHRSLIGEGPDFPNSARAWQERIHPDDLPHIRQTARNSLARPQGEFVTDYRIRHRDGHYVWIRSHGRVEQDRQGHPSRMIGMDFDISAQKQAEAEIRHMAYHDALTGLPNRTLLLDRMTQDFARSRRDATFGAVFLLDLDRFKAINDSLGHHFGDQVLRGVAARLAESVRASDTVARLGGDEFVVVAPAMASERKAAATQAGALAERLQTGLAGRYVVGEHELYSSACVGATLYPDGEDGPEAVLAQADLANQQAKRNGKGRVEFYVPVMERWLGERLALEKDLRQAIESGELYLVYQPKRTCSDARLVGLEALLRWRHPERGDIPPGEFIPVAEDSGLIIPIGAWVLRQVCEQLRTWTSNGTPCVPVAVNLSPVQFSQANLAEQVRSGLQTAELTGHWLELEVTEGAIMENVGDAREVLAALKQLGVAIAIDDFGTGYSSLGFLRDFPVDKLKIDKAFIAGIDATPRDRAIATSAIALGKALGLRIVAEGVETGSQLAFLRAQGCDEAQGFYLSRPVPADEIPRLPERLSLPDD